MKDLIDRREVLKLLSTMPPEEAMTKAMLIQSVKQMDAAQPERKKGKWINEVVYGEGHAQCSIRCNNPLCNFHYIDYLGDYNFCPNCGADMREVSE